MISKVLVALCAACAMLSVHARSLEAGTPPPPGASRRLRAKHMFNPTPGTTHPPGGEVRHHCSIVF